jgi:transposase
MLARVTSVGQRHDSLGYALMMDRIRIHRRDRGRPRTRPGQVLADKAYSGKAIRADLRRRGGRRPAFDKTAYWRRNTVEHAISRLKQNRTVATRYDNRDFVWCGTVDVAAIRIWLRDPVT